MRTKMYLDPANWFTACDIGLFKSNYKYRTMEKTTLKINKSAWSGHYHITAHQKGFYFVVLEYGFKDKQSALYALRQNKDFYLKKFNSKKQLIKK